MRAMYADLCFSNGSLAMLIIFPSVNVSKSARNSPMR